MESENCGKNLCKFDSYQVGEKDTSGREIEQIAYYEVHAYMIYFVKDDYLKAYYIDAYETKAYFQEEFQCLLGDIISMNIKNEENNQFVRQSLASAYYNAVSGYTKVAIGELKSLKNKLVYGCYLKWLTTYLICNLILISCCGLILFIYHNALINEISFCIISSCIGSFLVYTKKENDRAGEHYLPIIDAIITFFASCISGFLVYCILKSNLLLGTFNKNSYVMMMICFVAGYNEDIPLRLLKNLSNMVTTSKEIEGKANRS